MTLCLFSSKQPVLLLEHSIATVVLTGKCWLLCLKLWSLADSVPYCDWWICSIIHSVDCTVVSEDVAVEFVIYTDLY
jgi:hypothetical protein